MKILQKKYRAYTLKDLTSIDVLKDKLSSSTIQKMKKVAQVIPFRVNNYIIDELVDWNNIPDDPIFRLTFPNEEMLLPEHMEKLSLLDKEGATKEFKKSVIRSIRMDLNPHPNGQRKNVPRLEGDPLSGVQHKYNETVLFFPGAGQTCHAYCTFCFRWPQFTKMDKLKFGSDQVERLVSYLKKHEEVSDVLYTGGDPMILSTTKFEKYLNPILEADLPHVQNIRIGSKSLSYWPYRFISDKDADQMLRLFDRVVKKGKHLAFMAHFNHTAELQTPAVQEAIRRIRNTGAVIRTQSPIMKHINDSSEVWQEMWKAQVRQGLIPYYMFVARHTGAKNYFEIPLIKTFQIYKKAYKHVSGLARTVRGPSMSTYYGKIQILGVQRVFGEDHFVLRFLQARNKDWNGSPFLAKFSDTATWLSDLKPPTDQEEFFFERPSLEWQYN